MDGWMDGWIKKEYIIILSMSSMHKYNSTYLFIHTKPCQYLITYFKVARWDFYMIS